MTQAHLETSPPERPTLDVSGLRPIAWDSRSPLWWGNLLMIFSETTTIALLIAGYFYVARNYDVSPPPRVTLNPPLYETAPTLGWGTANLVLLLLSCVPMYLTTRAARRISDTGVRFGLMLMAALAILSLWFRWEEFHAVHFAWDDNAYASYVWAILVLHGIYVATGLGEMLLMDVWAWTHEMDEKHGFDVTLLGGFWYWTAGSGALVYAVIYWAPRLLGNPGGGSA